jgi:RNA polymerase sigma-70 factor (ECF subfamily)
MSREFATPVGTIKRRLHVARKRLRLEMERTSPDAPRELDRRNFSHEEDRELACV